MDNPNSGKQKTNRLYVFLAVIVAIILLFILLSLFRKWTCTKNGCRLIFGGDYSSETECVESCKLKWLCTSNLPENPTAEQLRIRKIHGPDRCVQVKGDIGVYNSLYECQQMCPGSKPIYYEPQVNPAFYVINTIVSLFVAGCGFVCRWSTGKPCYCPTCVDCPVCPTTVALGCPPCRPCPVAVEATDCPPCRPCPECEECPPKTFTYYPKEPSNELAPYPKKTYTYYPQEPKNELAPFPKTIAYYPKEPKNELAPYDPVKTFTYYPKKPELAPYNP